MSAARVLRWAAPLLLISSVALAQMDATQMSGVPRADKAVPEGVLTVKVLRGDLGSWAPAGTEVHLVGLGKDGKVTHAKAAVNQEGRAEFTDLAHDGSVVYYALTMLGDERLTSQPVLLPPGSGVRVALSGAKAGQPPIDNEVAPAMGADPHAHGASGGAKAKIPAGEVELLVRGNVAPNIKASLRPVAGGEAREAALTGGEDAMTARFTGVPAGGPYVAEVAVKGRSYLSTPFHMNQSAGVQRMILVFDDLLFAIQGGAQPDDDKMWFELVVTIANVGSAPFDPPGDGGVLIPLAEGFRNVKLQDEAGPFRVVDGKGLLVPGAVPPGQLSTTVQFSLPVKDGRVEFVMPVLYRLVQGSIAIVKGGSTVVSAAELGRAPRVQRSDDMREYYMLEGFVIEPGQTLRFTIAGLPMLPGWQGASKIAAGILVLLLAALALLVALIGRRGLVAGKPVDAETARRELSARKEKLYAELVALERLRAADRIDEADFDAQRKAIMAKLVLVHRELDDLDGGGHGAGQARAGS